MMDGDWDERFERVLRSNLPFLPPDGRLESSDALQELGLDSMGTIQLLLELEESYEVSFPDEALIADTFATPASLWKVLNSLALGAEP